MRISKLVIVALLALAPLPAAAQGARPSGTGALATAAIIVPPPFDLAGIRDLNFGVIVPGTGPVTVLPTSLQAAEGRGSGAEAVRSITVTMTLPAVLTGPGGVSLPLDFNGPYAATCEVTNANVCDAASLQTWNPVATPTHTDTPHNRTAQGRYRYTRFSIYLGGRALPGAGLRAGRYTGTVRVLVTWN